MTTSEKLARAEELRDTLKADGQLGLAAQAEGICLILGSLLREEAALESRLGGVEA